MKIQEAITYTIQFLKDFPSYKVDAFCLLKFVTKLNDLQIILNNEKELTLEQKNLLDACIKRRLKHEPIAHITGIKEFYGLEFKVNNQTLIPRPDSEMMVEKALEIIKNENLKAPKILELGIGSGAVILSILKNCTNAKGFAVDINPEAIKIAKKNADNLELSDKVTFIESNWFSNVKEKDFDVIISNPPYIESETIQTLDKEVKNFEPIIALDGGESGLDDYIQIINQAPDYLNKNGHLIFEIGYNQADDILALLENNVWNYKKCFKDLSNNDRLIITKLINSK